MIVFGRALNSWQYRKCNLLICTIALCVLLTGCKQNAQATCEEFLDIMLNIPQNAFAEVANTESIIVGKAKSEIGSFATDNTLFVNTVKKVFKDCVSKEALENENSSVYLLAANHLLATDNGWSYELKEVIIEKSKANSFSFEANIACNIPQGKSCAFGNDSTVKNFTLTGIIEMDSNNKVEVVKVNRYLDK